MNEYEPWKTQGVTEVQYWMNRYREAKREGEMDERSLRELVKDAAAAAYAAFIVGCVVAAILALILIAGCKHPPIVGGTQTATPTTTVTPHTDVQAGGDATVLQEIKTLQKSVQDMTQVTQAASNKLAGDIEKVESLVQNVSSTVTNYGISPEQKEIALKVVLCLLCGAFGLGLLGWAMPWPNFENPVTNLVFQIVLFGVGVALIAAPGLLLFIL